MNLLEAEGLTKQFGGVRAVDDVSFAVPAGQWLGVIGPNGAGKTTLFNMLGGQVRPSAGRIRFAGTDITRTPPHRRYEAGLGRSFQIASLFRGSSVVDHLALALRRSHRWSLFRSSLGEAALRREIAAALEAWELDAGPETLPDELPYGAQRRLELALAVASKPRLLLLDEPNVGLTAAECDDLLQRVRSLAHDVTVLVVAHDMEMVLTWSHRVLVMHFGALVADESPDDLLRNQLVSDVYLGSARAVAQEGSNAGAH